MKGKTIGIESTTRLMRHPQWRLSDTESVGETLPAELKRVTGVDAFRIDGVGGMAIQTAVGELGTELQVHRPQKSISLRG